MPTKQLLIAAALVVTMAVGSYAMAQDAVPAAATASTDQAALAKGKRHKMTFDQRKEKYIERTQQRLDCVKTAKDDDGLKACSKRGKKTAKTSAGKKAAAPAAAADAPAAQ